MRDLRHGESPSPLRQQSRLKVTCHLPSSPHLCPPVSSAAGEKGGESHGCSEKWQKPCRLTETYNNGKLCRVAAEQTGTQHGSVGHYRGSFPNWGKQTFLSYLGFSGLGEAHAIPHLGRAVTLLDVHRCERQPPSQKRQHSVGPYA